MADLTDLSTNLVLTRDIGQVVEELIHTAEDSRKTHERRWYDNNFFDDGHHSRHISRTTNKIVDQSERTSLYAPQRSIPKASRQIRGVANLLISQVPTPVVYPKRVRPGQFPPTPQQDPRTGQMVMIPNPGLQEAEKQAVDDAKKCGWWLHNEFEEQGIIEKLGQMAILTGKHSVSFMQIWPDPVEEKIRTQVYDSFDIYLMGNLNEIYDSPFVIKTAAQLISEIQANEDFDQDQVKKLTADNKQASSEIKEAYMKANFGGQMSRNRVPTVVLKEAYIKEYLNNDNIYRISQQEDGAEILQGKKKGDKVIRQVFAAGGIWLRDTYLNLPDYPFVEFRMEPGPIYQVPLIERFIPANRSLDLIVSRLERITNTMIAGIWMKRQGEQFEINNSSGAQIVEYSGTKPEQAQMAPIPSYPFALINLLESFIEEQGVTTSTLGKLPPGVHANSAIESLKESEYAQLIISTRRLRQTVKRIAEKMLDIADNHFVKAHEETYQDKGVTQNFDVMGAGAAQKLQGLGMKIPEGVVLVNKNAKVNIEVEAGIAYTKEGQKSSMLNLIDRMITFAQMGYLPPESVKVVIQKFLEVYQFGSTGEFMEAINGTEGNLADSQIQAIKVAVMEVMKDLITNKILPDEEMRINENKVAAAEVLKESGVADNIKALQEVPDNPELAPIPYKDAPPDIRRQMEANAGLVPSTEQSPAEVDQTIKATEVAIKARQIKAQAARSNNG